MPGQAALAGWGCWFVGEFVTFRRPRPDNNHWCYCGTTGTGSGHEPWRTVDGTAYTVRVIQPEGTGSFEPVPAQGTGGTARRL